MRRWLCDNNIIEVGGEGKGKGKGKGKGEGKGKGKGEGKGNIEEGKECKKCKMKWKNNHFFYFSSNSPLGGIFFVCWNCPKHHFVRFFFSSFFFDNSEEISFHNFII